VDSKQNKYLVVLSSELPIYWPPSSRMNRLPLVFLLYLLPLFSHSACAYTWPSLQYDAVETLLYEGQRSDGSSLSSLVAPCRKRVGTGASVPAEWLRFVRFCLLKSVVQDLFCPKIKQAFHDMATHNVDDGTGGMDGSIVYELGRSEVIFAAHICPRSRVSTYLFSITPRTLEWASTTLEMISRVFLTDLFLVCCYSTCYNIPAHLYLAFRCRCHSHRWYHGRRYLWRPCYPFPCRQTRRLGSSIE